MTNRLLIRAKSLDLDLAGEADYVLRAYDAVHTVLLERFVESVEGVLEENRGVADPPPDADAMSRTIPMHKAYDPNNLEVAERQHLNVVVCNEVYNKIYLLEVGEASKTPFARVIDFSKVKRVYINRTQRDDFTPFIKLGKVLWRELTTAGKAVVKGA